jgi:hypothetical protein
MVLQISDRFAGDRLLQRLQKSQHPLRGVPRIDNDMDVLRPLELCRAQVSQWSDSIRRLLAVM